MNVLRPVAALALCGALLTPPALAHEGHDDAPAAPTGQAPPRFALESEAFELVGVLQGQRLAIYLDRHASNEPVNDARIELQLDEARYSAQPHGNGEYEVMLPQPLPAGDVAVTATLALGQEADLLAGDLHIEQAAHADPAAMPAWRRYGPWAAGALALVAVLGLALSRRKGSASVEGARA
ncbi:hypothetical protein PGB34_00855 [Xenophilus arseniciresistens]|uniref:Uncharacterized protein n=1 Tax=Xenophilus arseniciresistens TaxID=1283306 RepID=A0AAE3N343_9BURK|nr:hypothetical protein [Xenophilus arseniciresistens]MDA7414900.1 hypothetical protein [Xenophilus arseniciresistens]